MIENRNQISKLQITNHNQQQKMIVKNLHRHFREKHRLVFQGSYQESRFNKILFFVKRILNKMANQDSRTFNNKMVDPNLPAQVQKPQSQLQAQKILQKNEQIIQAHEKSRLKRIDDILGTKTYFHEVKPYEQRIDSQNIMQITKLYHKHKDASRDQVDMLNPQIPGHLLNKYRRKHAKLLTKLKTYPKGNSDLVQFEEKADKISGQQSINMELINFLSEQALFTRLSLGQLQLVIESIQKERVYTLKNQQLKDIELQENYFIFNNQVYFRPQLLVSIYRIDAQKFDQKLVSSSEQLAEALTNNIGNIEEVITINEVYECLKNYYNDQRVSKYLAKIQNQEIEYFLSQLHISPDSTSIFVTIDLLGTQKEYVGLYKKLGGKGEQNQLILEQNVIFNIKANAAIRNNGQVYCVQRSEEGIFNEFVKVKFNESTIQSKKQDDVGNKIEKYKGSRQQTIIYRCKPYQQLNILTNNSAIATDKSSIMNPNIVVQQRKGSSDRDNRIYLFYHYPGLMQFQKDNKDSVMQQITANNVRLENLYTKLKAKEKFNHIQQWQTSSKNISSQCYQIIGIGYILIRYLFVESALKNDYLKFGNNPRYARFVTLVPYRHANITYKDTQNLIQGPKNIVIKQENQVAVSQKKQQNKQIEINSEEFQIDLPIQQWKALTNLSNENKQNYKLALDDEHIIFASPPQHFITNFQVKHSSVSNVYLLINHSIQSVYNRNSLYVHPLRKNVTPYSIYLDGFPIQLIDKNIGSGDKTSVDLKLLAPILSVNLKYTLWKRQIEQSLSNRIYTQTVTIKQGENGDEIKIKIVSGSKFIMRKKGENHQNQPTIIYLPSRNQRLDEIVVQKLIQKGGLFIQIIKCRGTFGTTMIDLIRGSKSFYENYLEDILDTIVFAKQNISDHVTIYAEGQSSCFATLLLNILYNQNNQLLDGCVLHEGLYDLSVLPESSEYFFGSDRKIFSELNPINFKITDPTKNQQEQVEQVDSKYEISNLSNIMISTLNEKNRAQSRKFINKLRSHKKVIFEKVFLKQFDTKQEKDIFNLAYLYKIMNDKMQTQYKEAQKQKYKDIRETGESISRDGKDKKTHTSEQ